MRNNSNGLRFAISTLLVTTIPVLIFSIAASFTLSKRIYREGWEEASHQSVETVRQLSTIDQLATAQVDSAMRTLQDQGRLKGTPSIEGTATLGGKTVPDLRLGTESQVQNFAIVDHVKELAGGTATLFAWDGTNFVRVSTNVLKPDGSRAIGTVLDPQGKAFAAAVQGRSFTGVVDILGSPYMTSYVPMLDDAGKLAGIWYAGYRLDSIAMLGKSIEEAQTLDHGFVALLKNSGAVVFHSKSVSAEEVDRLHKQPAGWVVHEEQYPAWGYTVLAAYPRSDVAYRLLNAMGVLVVSVLALVGFIVVLQFYLLNRQVLRPVRDLTERLANADLNTLIEIERHDEIGELASSFDQFVLRLRQTLLQVRDGSAAITAKSGDIRGISNGVVDRMSEQCQCAVDASAAVEQLSREIETSSARTNEVSEHTRAAAQAAREGNELVAATVTLIQGLSTDTQQSAGRVASLSERTKQIGTIVGVIRDIAAGTNLLALNASIEAARAGEHGRGFAVVAGEVRNLAERTAQATQQVGALISGIEQETAQASSDILAACAHASEGAGAVSELGSTFERIAGLVIEVDGRMMKIAGAADEEGSAAKTLRDAVRKVSASARESEDGAKKVMAAASDLLGTAHTLEGLVQQFELRELPQDYAG
jgi:methyl-accepting chemotaxis protein